jgi:hypothetical protein
MVFTKSLNLLSILVVIFSISVVLLEKFLPDQRELRRVEDLPDQLVDWFKRGKYYNVFGNRVFAIWNEKQSEGDSVFLLNKFASQVNHHKFS